MLGFQLKYRFQEPRTRKQSEKCHGCVLLSFVEPGLAGTLLERYRYNFQKTCTLGKFRYTKNSFGNFKKSTHVLAEKLSVFFKTFSGYIFKKPGLDLYWGHNIKCWVQCVH